MILTVNREKLTIPKDKPYIFLRGNGRGKTAIVSSQSSVDNIDSATFKVEAHDVVVFGISIKVIDSSLILHTRTYMYIYLHTLSYF